MLTSLIHCDDIKAKALAQTIENIESAEQAYRLRKFVEEARRRVGPDWQFTDAEAAAFFQQDARLVRDPAADVQARDASPDSNGRQA